MGDDDRRRLDAFGTEHRLEVGNRGLAEPLVALDPLEDRLELASSDWQLFRGLHPAHRGRGKGAQCLA